MSEADGSTRNIGRAARSKPGLERGRSGQLVDAAGRTWVPITMHDAKTHLSRFVARALAGERFVITKDGEPAVMLVPVRPKRRRQFGVLEGKASIGPEFFDPLPDEELKAWDEA